MKIPVPRTKLQVINIDFLKLQTILLKEKFR